MYVNFCSIHTLERDIRHKTIYQHIALSVGTTMVQHIRLYVTYPINEGKIMSDETPKIVKSKEKEQVENLQETKDAEQPI